MKKLDEFRASAKASFLKIVEQKDIHSSLPVRALKSQLAVERPSTGGHGTHQKVIPHAQRQKRSCSKMAGSEIIIKSNLVKTRRRSGKETYQLKRYWYNGSYLQWLGKSETNKTDVVCISDTVDNLQGCNNRYLFLQAGKCISGQTDMFIIPSKCSGSDDFSQFNV